MMWELVDGGSKRESRFFFLTGKDGWFKSIWKKEAMENADEIRVD